MRFGNLLFSRIPSLTPPAILSIHASLKTLAKNPAKKILNMSMTYPKMPYLITDVRIAGTDGNSVIKNQNIPVITIANRKQRIAMHQVPRYLHHPVC
jgi:hypothetical protein